MLLWGLPNRVYKDSFQGVDIYQPEIFLIIHLAACHNGILINELEGLLGEEAIHAIRELKQHEVVYYKNERCYLTENSDFTCSLSLVKHHVTTLARFYQPRRAGLRRNYASSLVQSLNRDAIAKLRDLHQEYHKKVYELMVDPENFGENPIFSMTMMDSFREDLKMEDDV